MNIEHFKYPQNLYLILLIVILHIKIKIKKNTPKPITQMRKDIS